MVRGETGMLCEFSSDELTCQFYWIIGQEFQALIIYGAGSSVNRVPHPASFTAETPGPRTS